METIGQSNKFLDTHKVLAIAIAIIATIISAYIIAQGGEAANKEKTNRGA